MERRVEALEERLERIETDLVVKRMTEDPYPTPPPIATQPYWEGRTIATNKITVSDGTAIKQAFLEDFARSKSGGW